MAKPNVIDSNSDEYNQRLCYYSLTINLDRCNENCNTCHDLSNRICVPNKTEDVNLSISSMITRKKMNKNH